MNAISRRDFLLGGALGSAGLVVGAAAPAQAAHITEPHEPVIGIGLNLWNYPDGTTKVTHRLLIPETGTQPPSGASTSPATVSLLDRIGPAGVEISTIPAVTWTEYESAVTFDPTTGLPVISGKAIRTEPFVAIGRTARQNHMPSEHWNSRLVIDRVTNLRRDNRAQMWNTLIHHANVPPHDPNGGDIVFKGGFWEAEQDNDYPFNERMLPGEIVSVTWQLDGWASRRRFSIEVKFAWGG